MGTWGIINENFPHIGCAVREDIFQTKNSLKMFPHEKNIMLSEFNKCLLKCEITLSRIVFNEDTL